METREGYARLIQRLQKPPTGPVPRLLIKVGEGRINKYPIELCKGVEVARVGSRYQLVIDSKSVCRVPQKWVMNTYLTGLGLRTGGGQVFGRGPGMDCPAELLAAFRTLEDWLPFGLRYQDGEWRCYTKDGYYAEMRDVPEAYRERQRLALAHARKLLRQPPVPIRMGMMGISLIHAEAIGTDYELAVLARVDGCVVLDERGQRASREVIDGGQYYVLPGTFPLRIQTVGQRAALTDPYGFAVLS